MSLTESKNTPETISEVQQMYKTQKFSGGALPVQYTVDTGF